VTEEMAATYSTGELLELAQTGTDAEARKAIELLNARGAGWVLGGTPSFGSAQ